MAAQKNDLKLPLPREKTLPSQSHDISVPMIRPADSTDLPAIAHLLVHCWRTCYRDILPPSALRDLNEEKQLSRHQQTYATGTPYWVAEGTGGEVIGFASVGAFRDDSEVDAQEIYTLYVHPDQHRHGLGSELLAEVEQAAFAEEDRLLLWVMSLNPWRVFYENRGYEPIEEGEMVLGSVPVPLELLEKRKPPQE